MSKTTKAEVKEQETISKVGGTIFDQIAAKAAKVKPQQGGVRLFKSDLGNEVSGVYMGTRTVSREEMKDDAIPTDNRVKNIETAYIRTGEFVAYRTGNQGAVQHFSIIQPGSYVRLRCTAEGVAGNKRAEFEVDILFTPEQLAAEFGEPSDLIAGFLQ